MQDTKQELKEVKNYSPVEIPKSMMKYDGIIQKEQENDDKPILYGKASLITGVYNPHYIKKKTEYRAFLKMLKTNSFTTAYMASRALRISPEVISNWLKTPKAIKLMNKDIDEYVSKIKGAKDWKASAYLLDKVTGTDEQTKSTAQMVGLSIVIQQPSK